MEWKISSKTIDIEIFYFFSKKNLSFQLPNEQFDHSNILSHHNWKVQQTAINLLTDVHDTKRIKKIKVTAAILRANKIVCLTCRDLPYSM
jgi:hypothetical protein